MINDEINCPNCNEYICKTHQTRPILVRDLSVFGHLVYLKVPRRQFYCPNCQTSPTEPLSWLNKKQRQTNRYQEYIYEKVRELTVKQVSENEKMCVAGEPRRSEDAIQDIFHKVAQLKKSGCALVGFPDGLAHQARLGAAYAIKFRRICQKERKRAICHNFDRSR